MKTKLKTRLDREGATFAEIFGAWDVVFNWQELVIDWPDPFADDKGLVFENEKEITKNG